TDFEQKFDAAFSRFGVMFFEEPARAFAQIRAQLREGGRLVFICWRSLQENIWAKTPIEAIAPMLKAPLPPSDPDAPGPFAFADEGKIRDVLSRAGWRDSTLARWDGDISIGGGGDLAEIADFMLRIGPCARAIADQALDAHEARRRVIEFVSPHFRSGGVALPAACWLVSARA
ncbi:MAG: class I SAM-dependent methyltransferase, partial [Hyphomonadaceae bacterium]